MSKPGPKYGLEERADVKARVAQLWRRGYNQVSIAADVDLAQPTVCIMIRKLREEQAERLTLAREAMVAEKLLQLQEVREEAWRGYEASRADLVRESVEVVEPLDRAEPDEDGKPKQRGHRKMTKVKEGRLAGHQWLAIVLQTIRDERDLLGLDAPKTVDARVQVVDWEAVARDVEEMPARDVIEARIEEVLAAPLNSGGKPDVRGARGRPRVLPDVDGTGDGEPAGAGAHEANGKSKGKRESKR